VTVRTTKHKRAKREHRWRRKAPRAVAYRRILLPLLAGGDSKQAAAIACRLAAEEGASVSAVAFVEVAPMLPLDAHMIEEEAQAKRLLLEAREIGDAHGVIVSTHIHRARAAGEEIVAEATRVRAEVIVLRTPRRKRATRRAPFGPTVDFVFKHAPCPVIVAAPRDDA
jgi:nucleotide-binding universal stress UspA family protein